MIYKKINLLTDNRLKDSMFLSSISTASALLAGLASFGILGYTKFGKKLITNYGFFDEWGFGFVLVVLSVYLLFGILSAGIGVKVMEIRGSFLRVLVVFVIVTVLLTISLWFLNPIVGFAAGVISLICSPVYLPIVYVYGGWKDRSGRKKLNREGL